MKEIIDFLQESIFPKNKTKAQKIRLKTARYTIVRGIFYKKSFSEPLLIFLTKSEATKVLNVIHYGVCGNHLEGRSLAYKAVTIGYFWSYLM